MDEAVVKFYRRLLRTDFLHAGSIENPTIFLDSVGERVQICSQAGNNFIHLYIKLRENSIENIKYLCTCDPTANVAVEILCSLALGKSIADVARLTPEDFYTVLGSPSEDLAKKAKGLLELIRMGLKRHLESRVSVSEKAG